MRYKLLLALFIVLLSFNANASLPAGIEEIYNVSDSPDDPSSFVLETNIGSFILPKPHPMKRDINLDISNVTIKPDMIDLTDIQNKDAVATSRNINFHLPHKTQATSISCWAACVASVGQYRTGINKTDQQAVNASGLRNIYASRYQISSVLYNQYNVQSTVNGEGFTVGFSSVKNQLDQGKPVILALFKYVFVGQNAKD